jgi:hypothetical protein
MNIHHFQTNDTTTDNDHLLGDFLERPLNDNSLAAAPHNTSAKFHLQSASACDNSLLIDLKSGEWGRLGSSSDDNVLTAQSALATISQVNLDLILVHEAAGTLNVVDAVFPIKTIVRYAFRGKPMAGKITHFNRNSTPFVRPSTEVSLAFNICCKLSLTSPTSIPRFFVSWRIW